MSRPAAVSEPQAGGATDWVVCRACGRLLYAKRLARNLRVCPECGSHHRLTAGQRLEQLLDPGSRVDLGFPVPQGDPLGFVDTKPYPQRLSEARSGTGLEEAVVCVRGAIEGVPLIAAVMDFRFMGGSLGNAVGELIASAAETALSERLPLLIVTASGGARMQEGVIALMQMAKTSQALRELDEAGIPTISLITDPTFGGVAASFATLCDVIVAEPGARLGFAGPRVIEQTTREKLPEGFQTAEFLLRNGMIDLVRRRAELRPAIAHLLAAGTRRPSGRRAVAEPRIVRDPTLVPERDAWEAVQHARDLRRPTTLEYISLMLDGFEELRGDRVSGDCPAIVGGIGRMAGIPLVLIGYQKGHTIAELSARNFGMPVPAGYRKSARLMRLAAKLGLPVVTLVDTPGADPGVKAEQGGQAVAIGENLRLMAGLPVPIVAVVTGEGGSGGALALTVADEVLAFSGAVYSVISPEGCAAILWRDAAAAPRAAEALRIGARHLLELGVADGVIPEPPGGAQSDAAAAAAALRAALVARLEELMSHDIAGLLSRRRARIRAFGRVPA
ncbi:acetyl-CoA carboxylase, carboxyltransferase subunit beta [Sphaerisporangium perillae]|uniref:acetyl-CoA carboxylase, carboxyltransferase subunit beta n=1 Tax=Sphaerisporangium perillae TaxID=2935860 RepID=UPI00200E04A3|nr:acetyl-CoA carboxylase, carboxyltransferase subunit beta [Sphaerisporangium perillae]